MSELNRQRILITDDSEINRMILRDMLEDEYEILEAENGQEAVDLVNAWRDGIDLILLDCVMPEKDGFWVLRELGRKWWKEDIPVIMISAENDQSFIVKAYTLGALDYISRPFNSAIVRHRVDSIMRLHMKDQHLAEVAAEGIMANHRNNNMMVQILSGIVEFRNGESGPHIINVQALTDMFMRELLSMTDKYKITDEEMSIIPMAAAMHDIGKISIPYKILNKPGRLTEEEFTIMKTHTTSGFGMLNAIEAYREEPLIKLSAQVCRWHHERYDGNGYPDGLEGDEIPIAAQLVSLADVYDALTSKRCYKEAYTPEKAVDMILNNECGVFNPLLIECFKNIAADIPERLKNLSSEQFYDENIYRIIENTIRPQRP